MKKTGTRKSVKSVAFYRIRATAAEGCNSIILHLADGASVSIMLSRSVNSIITGIVPSPSDKLTIRAQKLGKEITVRDWPTGKELSIN